MKKNIWLFLGILLLLAVAAIAYFGATAIMDSLFNFRSPLANDPPPSGVSLGEPLTDRLVIILVDALREDTSLNKDVMPYLNELRQGGAWATMYSVPPSYSAPSWTSILTGAWPDINDGQSANPPDINSVRTFTQSDIFSIADGANLQTAVSGFSWFEGMLANSGVDASFYTIGEDNAADIDVVNAAIPWLESNHYQLILIHLDQVDYAGHHEGGPQDPNWNAAAARVDSMIREIVKTLDFERDTLIVTSDHGQIDRGGHGGQDAITLVEPFVMVGRSVITGNYPSILMVDIAPTVTALLGTSLPGTNQGRVLTEMLSTTHLQNEAFNQAMFDQKYILLLKYQNGIGIDTSPPPETSEQVDQAMQEIKDERLKQERLPRGIIAMTLALIPAVILYLNLSQTVTWLARGAALYTLIFNLIYAVIIGKTYSLSSVYSADDLIFSTAIYAAVSLFIAWLVVMLSLKAFSTPPSSAAKITLAFTCITLYLLLLPILWNYYRNGILITWTLPEFGSMFLGFLSIVQSLFVAVLGILLIGISALIAKFVPNL